MNMSMNDNEGEGKVYIDMTYKGKIAHILEKVESNLKLPRCLGAEDTSRLPAGRRFNQVGRAEFADLTLLRSARRWAQWKIHNMNRSKKAIWYLSLAICLFRSMPKDM